MGTLITLIIFSWAKSLQADPTRHCSTLLQSLIEATEKQQVTSHRDQNLSRQTWSVGTQTLELSYEPGKLTLRGAKEDITLKVDLTADQLERLKKFTKTNANSLGPSLNKDSLQSALKTSINYAKLHSAFYRENANPLEAAKSIEALIVRSEKRHSSIKTRVSLAATEKAFLENSGKLAESLSGLVDLERLGRLKDAVQEYQKDQQERQGAQILDSMLAGEPEKKLSEVIEATENREKAENPDAVELKIDFGHDEPRIVLIEKSTTGGLKVIPRGAPGFRVKSLRQLVNWLQGQGFDGKSYDWRTYEFLENSSF